MGDGLVKTAYRILVSKTLHQFLFAPENHAEVIQRAEGWDRIDVKGVFSRIGSKGIEWQQQPVENELSLRIDGFRFRIKSSLQPEDLTNMGDFYPAHYYLSPKFIEMECHGPTHMTPPGAEVSLAETWEVAPD